MIRKETALTTRSFATLLFAFIAISLTSGSTVSAASKADEQKPTVASMGKTSVSAHLVQQIIDALEPDSKKAVADNPRLLEKIVRDEVVRQFVVGKAKEAKLHQEPDMAFLMERAKNRLLLNKYIAEKARVPDDYPSTSDVIDFYENNKEQFVVPTRIHLAQVFIDLPPDADKKAVNEGQKKAQNVASLLNKAGADFSKIAKERSEDPASAANGGDMGWISEPLILPQIRDAIDGVEEGNLSQPVRSNRGWHIVKVIDRQPATVRPVLEVRNQIIEALRKAKRRATRREFIRKLLEEHPIEIDEKALLNIKLEDS